MSSVPPGTPPNTPPNPHPGSSSGSSSAGIPPGGVGRRIEEAVELIEMELRHAIAYVNDAVVPEVRRESISAMRKLSEALSKLADRIDPPQPGSRPR